MKDYNKKVGIIALSGLKGIGPAFIKKVIGNNSFQSSALHNEITQILNLNKKDFDENTIESEIEHASLIVDKCKEENISIVDFTEDDFPLSLKEIKDAPPLIYCKGNLELLYQKSICIIGTREPNNHGAEIAERIGSYFSRSGWSICNGLAEGIDVAAIQSEGKFHDKIIGVLAGGLNYNSHKTLLKKTALNAENVIQNGGVLISEMPPDKKEDTFSIVKSCRIQAGLSTALILVQSSMSGGSRYTTKSYCETARPIAVIQPIQSDYNTPQYEANKEIIENKRGGLVKFTHLKEDQIHTKVIYTIKSKEDYKIFEDIIVGGKTNIEKSNPTLF
jgi:DNA processing protein